MNRTLLIILSIALGAISLLIPYYIGYYSATKEINFFLEISLYVITLTISDIRYKLKEQYK